MSKRPRIKQADGSLLDLPLDAETIKGKTLEEIALKTDIPTKTSQLTNDSNFLTEHQDISGKLDKEEFDTLKDELDNGDFVVSTASFAEADNAGNRIIETYATKTEIPTKISQLEQDVELGVSEEDVMDIIENNAEQTNTLDVGTSATFNPESDKQIPTSKAVAEMVTDAVDNFKTDEFEPFKQEVETELGYTIDLSINSSTYVLTLNLKNKEGTTISTGTVDLPLETMVISARYADGKLYLTTKDGNELEGIDISNIVSGLVPNTRTVNGKALSSDITLNKADVGLSNVDNTSDADKPVSTATAAALALKADKIELNKYALKTNVPTKVSQLENDSGYINQHQDISGKADKKDIPTKTSQLTNNSGFITNAVNNLTNYYLKSETYTKSEVQQLLSTISSLKLEVVTSLPTTNISTNTIYLKSLTTTDSNNTYEEYVYINKKWEIIGNTKVDLSDYAKLIDIDNIKNGTTIVEKATRDSAGNKIIDTYATKTEIPTKTEINTMIADYINSNYENGDEGSY